MVYAGSRGTGRRSRPWIVAATLPLAVALAAHAGEKADAPAPAATGPAPAAAPKEATAVFAGGCFWCLEKPFDELDGVLSTTSGYTGGKLPDPTYEQVSDGDTGHVEAVRVTYDPARVSYEKLVDVFWRNVDPLDAHGQFCDKGYQYTSAIFVADEEQRRVAEASKREIEASGRLDGPVVTRIEATAPFYEAEGYHQDYYEKNPIRYRYYRYACGRDQRLTEVWGEDAAPH